MFTILFHSSKTMRSSSESSLREYSEPPLLKQANELIDYLKTLDSDQIGSVMKVSPVLADRTVTGFKNWQERRYTLPAIDAFLGDMYSGLQSQTFSSEDRAYAQKHLYILSGLYGVARALDGVHPYRLEMGYKLPDDPYSNLYDFWGDRIVKQLPSNQPILNLSVNEFTKAVFPHLTKTLIITPLFLTVKKGDVKPKAVVVHSKIARGAFARWVIINKIDTPEGLQGFTELGYHYNPTLSTSSQPVYVTKKFQGLGLSVRKAK